MQELVILEMDLTQLGSLIEKIILNNAELGCKKIFLICKNFLS